LGRLFRGWKTTRFYVNSDTSPWCFPAAGAPSARQTGFDTRCSRLRTRPCGARLTRRGSSN